MFLVEYLRQERWSWKGFHIITNTPCVFTLSRPLPPPRPQFWDREGAGRQPGSCNAEIWVSLKRVQFSGIFHRFHDSTPLQAANSNPSPDILCHHTQQSTGCSNMSESIMNNWLQRVSQWVRVYIYEIKYFMALNPLTLMVKLLLLTLIGVEMFTNSWNY